MDDGPPTKINFFFIFIKVLEINIRRTTLFSKSTFSLEASTISTNFLAVVVETKGCRPSFLSLLLPKSHTTFRKRFLLTENVRSIGIIETAHCPTGV